MQWNPVAENSAKCARLAAHAHTAPRSLRLRIKKIVRRKNGRVQNHQTSVLDASDFHVGDSENECVIHQVLFTLFRFVEI